MAFQFPTGWNSTLLNSLPRIGCEQVSIPNGMEFYYVFTRANFKKRVSFNSQRDGILLTAFLCSTFFLGGSIPNGMEFYYTGAFSTDPDVWFQFPTGWNSTLPPLSGGIS